VWVALAALAAGLAVGGAVWVFGGGPAVEAKHTPPQAVPFTSFPGSESDPAFSPDGNRVVFAWDGERLENFDIYLKEVGSDRAIRLTADPAPEGCPVWSPQGDWVAFARTRCAETTDLYLMPSGGGPERKIAETRASKCGLAWSPDGKWLVTPDRDWEKEPLGLFLVSVETGEKRRLTRLELPHFAQTAAFSTSGRFLVFPGLVSGGSSDLFLMEFDNEFWPVGQPKRLTFTLAKTGGAIWMADGRSLVYASGEWGAESYLWEIGVESRSRPQPLTSLGDDADQAAYSPVTNRLVYRRRHEDVNIWRFKLSREPAVVDDPVKLLASTRIDYNPQFSPDGKRIAFHSTRSGRSEIWVADADGSNAYQLTSMGAPVTGSPRWSPDGRQLAFDSNAEGNYEVYVVDAAGSTPRRLTEHPADDGVPSWSVDGRWIYFESSRSGRHQIWKAPAKGGPPVQVTRGGGYVAFESPDGKFLYYQKELPASSIWTVSVDGGQETELIASSSWMNFTVTPKGIYFIPAVVEGAPAAIEFFDFTTRAVRRVVQLPRPPGLGLSVSHDGRWLLYSQVDRYESDLMLVENFR
jgi:Tol biopolymer transport system component